MCRNLPGAWGLPFFKLLKHQEKFVWTLEADQALAQLKDFLSKPPVLTAPGKKEQLLLYFAATTHVEMSLGTRNPSTRWVLPDKETGMEIYFYPRVHKWATCIHWVSGCGCGYILLTLGVRLTETDRFGSSVIRLIRLPTNLELIGSSENSEPRLFGFG
jgi:hypothetical protein